MAQNDAPLPPTNAPRASGLRRVLGVFGAVLGTAAVFAVSTVGGVLLHLNLPAARRTIAVQVNHVLAPSFRGKLTIARIGRIGLTGLSGVTVELADPEGVRVARLDGVSARIDTVDLVRSLASGKGPMRIAIPELRVGAGDVSIDTDATGALNLARAFESASPPPPPDEPPGRGVRIDLPDIAVGHLWVHGQMKGAPALDADVDRVHARVGVVPLPATTPNGASTTGVTIDVDRLHLAGRGMPNGANPQGDVTLHVALPSASGKELGLEAAFTGDVAGVPLTAKATMDGERLDAVADVPHAASAQVRALAPNVPLSEDVSAHVEAHGSLPHLTTTAHATVGKGEVNAKAEVTLSPVLTVDLSAEARHIDVHAVSSTSSDLSADVAAKVRLDDKGAPQGTYTVKVLPGMAAGQRVPATNLAGRIAGDTITVRGAVSEPGAPTQVALTLRNGGKEPTVAFEVHTHVARLDRIARIGPIAEGSAEVHARGMIVLGSPTIDARIDVEGQDIARDGITLDRLQLEGRVRGELTNPFVDVNVRGRDLALQDRRFSDVNVHVRGPAMAPVVGAVLNGEPGTPRVEVAMKIALAPESGNVTLSKVRAAVVQPDATLVARAEKVRIGKEGVVTENTVVEGMGEPTWVDLEKTREGLRVRLRNKGLEIAKVARLAQLDEDTFRAGTVDLDVDLVVHKKGVNGKAAIAVHEAAVGPVDGASAELDAHFEERRVTVGLHAEAAQFGRVDIHTSTLEVPGSPLDPKSWKQVTGKVHIDTQTELARLSPLLPESAPVRPTHGLLLVEADVGRDRADGDPDVELSVLTKDLALVGKTERAVDAKGTEIVGPVPWSLAGIDLAFDANIEGKSGQTRLVTRVTDATAKLAELEVESQLPYHEVALGALDGKTAHVVGLLERTPLTASFTLPRRRLDSYPAILRTQGLAGELELGLHVEGTAHDPRIALEVHSHDVKRTKALHNLPVSTDVLARYAAGKGDVEAHMRLPQGEVLTVNAEGHGRFADLLQPPAKPPEWDASVRAKITRFPLDSVPYLADRQIRGRLDGELALLDLHRAARAHVAISLDGLHVGRATYTAGKITFDTGEEDANGKNVHARVRLDQSDGFADVQASARAAWGTAVAPSLDETKPVEAEIKANGFRTAALLPFAEPQLSDLDGRLDANARLRLGPRGPGSKENRPTMEGTVTFREGIVEIPTMGERLSGVHAAVAVDKDGLVRVDGIEARTEDGRLLGNASARLDGVRLVGANASLRIPERESFPISLHGETLGETYGNVDIKVATTPDRKTMNVDVDVPSMHVKLPENSTQDVLDLDRPKKIRVGVYRNPKQLTVLPLSPGDLEPEQPTAPGENTKLVVKVNLGRDIEIKRGTGIKVRMEGEPTVTINSETRMTGQIRLLSGYLEVQSKRFEIERGTVTFTGDPSNPTASITAGWTAPSGTRVYADFIGPIKTGKVNLRSEPARTKSEIFALILNGTEGGQNAPSRAPQSSQDQSVNMGIGLVGGSATQGLNKAIQGLTGTDFATVRIDTSNSANPRPEVEFQLSRQVSLQLATVFGRLPIDQPDRNFATIDWRFRRNWSLETTFGDQGTSLFDLIWQKRY